MAVAVAGVVSPNLSSIHSIPSTIYATHTSDIPLRNNFLN